MSQQTSFTFDQELHCLANHSLVKFKDKMYNIYGIEFDKVETQEIQELLLEFYEKAEKLKDAQCK